MLHTFKKSDNTQNSTSVDQSIKYLNHFMLTLLAIFIIPSILLAGGGGDDGCTAGEAACPIELTLNGNKENNREPDEFYKFLVPASQDISVKIFDHDEYYWRFFSKEYYELTLTLRPVNDDGSCNTEVLPLAQIDNKTRGFQLDDDVEGGKFYCIEASGDNSDQYDIEVDGAANLEVGIDDASQREDESPMTFYVVLTKASPTDVTVAYTFQNATAINGTNYTGVSSTATILANTLSTTIEVPLIDKGMTITKTFTVSISSGDVPVSSTDGTATGKIIGSNTKDADHDYQGPDICYESRPTRGFCFFGTCLFYKQTTNVKAMVNGLSDIHIQKALTRGFTFIDFFSGIGIDGDRMTGQTDSDRAENKQFAGFDFVPNSYYLMSMFPLGYDYRIGNDPVINPTPACISGPDYPWYKFVDKITPIEPPFKDNTCKVQGGSMDKDDTTSYFDKAFFKFGLFTQYTHLVTYTKDGQTYQEVLQPCESDIYGTLAAKPLLGGCGLFLKEINSATSVNNDPTRSCNNGGICNTAIAVQDVVLPSFRTSDESSSANVDYSTVIAEQHIGTLNVSLKNADQGHNIVFEAPYSASYGKRVMFINTINENNSGSDTYHYIFSKGGDYWIENWNFNNTSGKTITIETDAKAGEEVRIFVKNNLHMVAANIVIRNKYDNNKFHLYAYEELSTSGTMTINDGYIYADESMTFADDTDVNRGAISSHGPIITNGGDFNYPDDAPEDSIYAQCPTFGGNYTTGQFDAWDVFRSMDSNITDRHISTKIAGADFDLTIASLNVDRNATEAKPGIDVRYALFNIHPISNAYTQLEDWQTYNADSEDRITASYVDMDTAHQKTGVIFKVCADYNATSQLYQYSGLASCVRDCSTNVDETVAHPCLRYFESSDKFSVRPNAFDVNLTDNQVITAEKPVNLQFKALKAASSDGAGDYNQTESANGSFAMELNLYPSGLECQHLTAENSPDINFTDGTFTDNISFNRIGTFTVSIQESSDCDDRFAKVDCIDTPAGSWTVSDTAIDPTEVNVTIIPDHFDIVDSYIDHHVDFGTPANNFTYLSNFDTAAGRSMASEYNLTIIAKKANAATASNYTDTCFAKNLDISIDYDTHGAALATLNNLQFYETSLDVDKTNVPLGSSLDRTFIKPVVSGVLGIFNEEINGTANVTYRINFDRKYNTAINPFTFTLKDITLADSDISSSWPVNLSAHFYAAKLRPSQLFYDDVSASSIRTPVSVAIYCTGGCGYGTQTNDAWRISTAHNVAQDGSFMLAKDVGTLTQDATRLISGTNNDILVGYTGATLPTIVNISYDTANTSPWLIYNASSPTVAPASLYKVRFIGKMGWAGHGDTGFVVDTNASVKKNRRMNW